MPPKKFQHFCASVESHAKSRLVPQDTHYIMYRLVLQQWKIQGMLQRGKWVNVNQLHNCTEREIIFGQNFHHHWLNPINDSVNRKTLYNSAGNYEPIPSREFSLHFSFCDHSGGSCKLTMAIAFHLNSIQLHLEHGHILTQRASKQTFI